MSKGSIFIVSGPSGSGKDTVLGELFKRCPDLSFSISSITRDMRKGEKQGEKYNFISREEFEGMLQRNELLEHNIYLDNYYGTPRIPVEECVNAGRDMIIEVDVNGAAQIRKNAPQAISVFIMPPSLEVLKSRLSGRGTESTEAVEARLAEALNEIKRADEFDYIVVNDDLSAAVDDFVSVIKSRRIRLENKKHLIDEILK